MTAPQIIVPDEIDFARYMRESEPKAKVRPATEFRAEVISLASPCPEQDRRIKMPFNGCWMYFRPEEVTAWAGFNGSGKSLLQGQAMVNLASHGQRCAIASFEMSPARTLLRMVRQECGVVLPNQQQIDAFLERYGAHLWFYNQRGSVTPERMLAVVRYCSEELGVSHIGIDSMMKCIRGEDDYNGQKDFVDALTQNARELKLHVHLVHHLRKGENDEKQPTRMDMRGAGAISDLVDNVLLLWRNKAKERINASGGAGREHEPDAVLICDKQRNGDWEGKVPLWFEANGQRFSDRKNQSREVSA